MAPYRNIYGKGESKQYHFQPEISTVKAMANYKILYGNHVPLSYTESIWFQLSEVFT